jgi:predicted RecA/RadA family phage recombinase
MATAKFRRGDVRTVTYLAEADVAVHEIVVLGVVDEKPARVGVAMGVIANGATGPVAVTGVWEFPKVSGAVIKAGESVFWDASEAAVDDNAMDPDDTGDVRQFGCAMANAGDGVTVIDLDIKEPGTYEATGAE